MQEGEEPVERTAGGAEAAKPEEEGRTSAAEEEKWSPPQGAAPAAAAPAAAATLAAINLEECHPAAGQEQQQRGTAPGRAGGQHRRVPSGAACGGGSHKGITLGHLRQMTSKVLALQVRINSGYACHIASLLLLLLWSCSDIDKKKIVWLR